MVCAVRDGGVHDGALQQRVAVLGVNLQRLVNIRHADRVGLLVRVLKPRHCEKSAD